MGRKLKGPRALVLGGVLAAMVAGAAMAADAPLPPGVTLRAGETGQVLAAADGSPLYRLDFDRYVKRRKGQADRIMARCGEVCDRHWRPVLAPKDFKPEGDWTVEQRPKGAQLAYKGDPLYTFAGENLEEAGKIRAAPSYFSSYTAKPSLLVDGVPMATRYWHEAVYQPAPPKMATPPGVELRWLDTGFVLSDADKRILYTQATKRDCEGECGGLEPLAAPLAAVPVGDWRPTFSEKGDRYWTYRGRAVFAAKGEVNKAEWKPIEVR